MTSTPNTTVVEDWPTEWHMLDSIQGVEVRQLSMNTYQLRNASHEITIDAEGFALYRESDKDFERWLDENLVDEPKDSNGKS